MHCFSTVILVTAFHPFIAKMDGHTNRMLRKLSLM
uniref:Uncharacterized protein n=1 Tax=Arundo donax TaxID=35708 RepID=A0A0A9HDS2_ARUDO